MTGLDGPDQPPQVAGAPNSGWAALAIASAGNDGSSAVMRTGSGSRSSWSGTGSSAADRAPAAPAAVRVLAVALRRGDLGQPCQPSFSRAA
jgi:hypothetical protein